MSLEPCWTQVPLNCPLINKSPNKATKIKCTDLTALNDLTWTCSTFCFTRKAWSLYLFLKGGKKQQFFQNIPLDAARLIKLLLPPRRTSFFKVPIITPVSLLQSESLTTEYKRMQRPAVLPLWCDKQSYSGLFWEGQEPCMFSLQITWLIFLWVRVILADWLILI